MISSFCGVFIRALPGILICVFRNPAGAVEESRDPDPIRFSKHPPGLPAPL